MSSNDSRPKAQSMHIDGPAGAIEALIESPQTAAAAAVICHPHPLHGGAMTNKVVHMLAKACNEAGAAAVRFNFRGVGASEGSYADGIGETDDALAVLEWSAQRWSGAPLWLAGFSFGGAVAIRAAAAREVARLITVAPAIQRVDVSRSTPHCPWLLVQGERDELVDAAEVQHWAGALDPRPQLELLPGVDHFFHGRLNLLKDVVVGWLANHGSQYRSPGAPT